MDRPLTSEEIGRALQGFIGSARLLRAHEQGSETTLRWTPNSMEQLGEHARRLCEATVTAEDAPTG